MVPAEVLWANLDSDVAILLPLNHLKETEPSGYINNRARDLDGKSLYFHGYPSDHAGLLINGFVSSTDYSTIIMQSNAWFGASGSVVPFGGPIAIAAIIAAIAGAIMTIGGLMSFSDLPITKGANLKSGAALFHPGETVVNDVDLKQLAAGGGKSEIIAKQTDQTIKELRAEIKAMRQDNQTYFGAGGSVAGTITRGFDSTIRNA